MSVKYFPTELIIEGALLSLSTTVLAICWLQTALYSHSSLKHSGSISGGLAGAGSPGELHASVYSSIECKHLLNRCPLVLSVVRGDSTHSVPPRSLLVLHCWQFISVEIARMIRRKKNGFYSNNGQIELEIICCMSWYK